MFAVARPAPAGPVRAAVNVADTLAPLPSAVTAAAGSFTVSVSDLPAFTVPFTGPSLYVFDVCLPCLGLAPINWVSVPVRFTLPAWSH